MAFDPYAIQVDIKNYLVTQFPNYEFFDNTIPEDLSVPRDVGPEVNPFFVVQYGPMMPRIRGKSMAGARNDEYYSWVQVIAMGSVDDEIRSALSLITDRLLGFKPAQATRLVPDTASGADYGSRQYSVRPVLYYASQRFEYNIAQHGLDGHLSA